MWVRIAWKQGVLGNCRAGFITTERDDYTTERGGGLFFVVCSSAFRRLIAAEADRSTASDQQGELSGARRGPAVPESPGNGLQDTRFWPSF